MGRKSVNGMAGFVILGVLATVAACFLPQHRIDFFSGFVLNVATMKTHLTTVEFPVGKMRFCKGVFDGAHKKGDKKNLGEEKHRSEGFCKHIEGFHDIQDVTMALCSPAIRIVWPQFCDGLEQARIFGIAMVIAIATNALCSFAGLYLIHDYATRKANPQYKSIGLGLIVAGAMGMCFVVGAYLLFVLQNLDSVGGNGWSSAFLTTGKNNGTQPGFVVLAMGVVSQFCSLMFLPWIDDPDGEEDYLDRKLEKAEGGYGAVGGAHQGGGHMQQQNMQQSNMQGGMAGMGMSPGVPMQMQPVVMHSAPMPMMTPAPAMSTSVGMGMSSGGGAMMGGGTMMGGGAMTMASGGMAASSMTVVSGPAITYEDGPSKPRELGNTKAF